MSDIFLIMETIVLVGGLVLLGVLTIYRIFRPRKEFLPNVYEGPKGKMPNEFVSMWPKPNSFVTKGYVKIVRKDVEEGKIGKIAYSAYKLSLSNWSKLFGIPVVGRFSGARGFFILEISAPSRDSFYIQTKSAKFLDNPTWNTPFDLSTWSAISVNPQFDAQFKTYIPNKNSKKSLHSIESEKTNSLIEHSKYYSILAHEGKIFVFSTNSDKRVDDDMKQTAQLIYALME